MNKRKSQEPRAIEVAPDWEKRDFPDVEAMFARFRAAEHDPAALDALMADSLAEIKAVLAEDRKQREYLMQHALAHLKTPREQKKRQAAFIRRVRDAVAAELQRRGMRNPVARAEEVVAKQYGFPSRVALNKWLRRNR